MNALIEAVEQIQTKYPQLILCGSVALMLQDLLDRRNPSDIDFVVTHQNLPSIWAMTEDAYAGNDKYRSFYFHHRNKLFGKTFKINVLVFEDDYIIKSEVVNCHGKSFTMEDVDEILRWKKDYGRDKDLKDIENVTLKTIEKTFLNNEATHSSVTLK
jgi:hypothetical protein